jgi:hypothetical protein
MLNHSKVSDRNTWYQFLEPWQIDIIQSETKIPYKYWRPSCVSSQSRIVPSANKDVQKLLKLTCGGCITWEDMYCEMTRRTGNTRYAKVSDQPRGGWPSYSFSNYTDVRNIKQTPYSQKVSITILKQSYLNKHLGASLATSFSLGKMKIL